MHSVLGSIISMAALAMAAPATDSLPARQEATCVDESSDVTLWNVIGFDYHSSEIFTTPAHQNSWGFVNFTLENPVLDYRPICSAQSNHLSDFYYGDLVYECTLPGTNDTGAASFTFNRPTGELLVNQTWYCPDEGARFQAKGGVTLDLTCEEDKWQNPDYQQGEIWSTRFITCNLVDVETPITEISAVLRR